MFSWHTFIRAFYMQIPKDMLITHKNLDAYNNVKLTCNRIGEESSQELATALPKDTGADSLVSLMLSQLSVAQ